MTLVTLDVENENRGNGSRPVCKDTAGSEGALASWAPASRPARLEPCDPKVDDADVGERAAAVVSAVNKTVNLVGAISIILEKNYDPLTYRTSLQLFRESGGLISRGV